MPLDHRWFGGGCAGACCGPSLVARTVTERATPSAAAATHADPALICASLPVPGQGLRGPDVTIVACTTSTGPPVSSGVTWHSVRGSDVRLVVPCRGSLECIRCAGLDSCGVLHLARDGAGTDALANGTRRAIPTRPAVAETRRRRGRHAAARVGPAASAHPGQRPGHRGSRWRERGHRPRRASHRAAPRRCWRSDVQGGTFQPDVLFRGFGGSPLLGASEGLAVYVDGMRANEPFGDIVNWDGLAPGAIAGINVMAGLQPAVRTQCARRRGVGTDAGWVRRPRCACGALGWGLRALPGRRRSRVACARDWPVSSPVRCSTRQGGATTRPRRCVAVSARAVGGAGRQPSTWPLTRRQQRPAGQRHRARAAAGGTSQRRVHASRSHRQRSRRVHLPLRSSRDADAPPRNHGLPSSRSHRHAQWRCG